MAVGQQNNDKNENMGGYVGEVELGLGWENVGNSTSSSTGGNIKVGLPKYVTSGKTTVEDSGLIKWIIVATAVVAVAFFGRSAK